MRTLIRPTAFVDSPFGHDGKVARLAGGLNWFAAVELIGVDGPKRVSTDLVPVEGIESRFDDEMSAQWQALSWRSASSFSASCLSRGLAPCPLPTLHRPQHYRLCQRASRAGATISRDGVEGVAAALTFGGAKILIRQPFLPRFLAISGKFRI